MHSLAETRRAQRHRAAEHRHATGRHKPSPENTARVSVQLGVGLLGLALFGVVGGVAALVDGHHPGLAAALRGWGLLAGCILAVGGSMLINKRRNS